MTDHRSSTNSAVSLDDLLNKEQQKLEIGDSYKSTGRRTELATSYTVSSNNTFTTSNTSLSVSDRAGARNSPPADGGTSPDSSTEGGSSSFPNINNNNTSMNSSTNQQQETTNTIINNRPKERRLPQSQQEGSFTATQLSSTIQQRPTFRSPTLASASNTSSTQHVGGPGGLNKMSSFKEEELHDSMTLPDVFAEDTPPSNNFNTSGSGSSNLHNSASKTSSSRSMNSSTNTRRRSNSSGGVGSKNHHSTGSSNNESDESSILLDVSWGSQNYDKAL